MPAPRLLVVHHTVSPHLEEMLCAVLDGTRAEGIEGVDVTVRPALAASVTDVLEADGFLLGTPANMGYMAGALKHFFDTVYYPALHAKPAAPYGLWVHGNLDVAGAARSVHALATGLSWRRAHDDVVILGTPDRAGLDECFDLGGTLAATLMGG